MSEFSLGALNIFPQLFNSAYSLFFFKSIMSKMSQDISAGIFLNTHTVSPLEDHSHFALQVVFQISSLNQRHNADFFFLGVPGGRQEKGRVQRTGPGHRRSTGTGPGQVRSVACLYGCFQICLEMGCLHRAIVRKNMKTLISLNSDINNPSNLKHHRLFKKWLLIQISYIKIHNGF